MRIASASLRTLEVMVDLAKSDRPVNVARLSRRHAVSESYLGILFARLRESGLVEGVRGPGGGYVLARSPEFISALDVVLAVDNDALLDAKSAALLEGSDARQADLWDRLSVRASEFLKGVSIQHLTDTQAARTAIGAQAAAWPCWETADNASQASSLSSQSTRKAAPQGTVLPR